MSLLTIRCWLHVIRTLQFVRIGMLSLEQHFHHNPGVDELREAWNLELSTESHEIEDKLQVLAESQEADDKLSRLRSEAQSGQ